MSRSSKKGPFLDSRLMEKVQKARETNDGKAIKTWARSSTISPEMVGMNFGVYNGREHLNVFVSESMVGHKLGEFSPTRKFTGHSKKGKIAKSTGSAGRVTE